MREPRAVGVGVEVVRVWHRKGRCFDGTGAGKPRVFGGHKPGVGDQLLVGFACQDVPGCGVPAVVGAQNVKRKDAFISSIDVGVLL